MLPAREYVITASGKRSKIVFNQQTILLLGVSHHVVEPNWLDVYPGWVYVVIN